MDTYLLQWPFVFSVSTRTALDQHPQVDTLLTAQSNINNPLHHPQDSRGSPGWDHFAILPHDAHMLGVLFLAAGLNCLHRSGLLYSKRMTDRG